MKIKLFGITILETELNNRETEKPWEKFRISEQSYNWQKGAYNEDGCLHQTPPCSGCKREFRK